MEASPPCARTTNHVQGESGTTPLYGGGHDVQHHHTTTKTKPPNPPPVGKAGFEESGVLSKGGLVSVHHCRQFCTVVYVHLVGRYVEPSGACVYRYGQLGMVRSPKANLPIEFD
jgi:hypothetical protein